MAQEELPDFAGLAASPGYLLARLGAEARRRWGRMLAERGLTPHQFGVLTALDRLGTASQRRLSALIGVDPRNAAPVLDGLHERGLIERENDPADRRRLVIGLTADGRAAAEELRGAGAHLEDEMLSGLSPAERQRLHRLLGKLSKTAL